MNCNCNLFMFAFIRFPFSYESYSSHGFRWLWWGRWSLLKRLAAIRTVSNIRGRKLQPHSQSCWLISYRPFPKLPAGTAPRVCSPVDGFSVGTVQWWNSTSQIKEWPGTVRLAALWIALLVSYLCGAYVCTRTAFNLEVFLKHFNAEMQLWILDPNTRGVS